MPLINSKVELSLRWIGSCMLTTAAIGDNANATGADSAAFVTLSTQANEKLSKLLGEGFKRSIYWKKYKVMDNIKVNIAQNNEKKYIRKLLESSYQEFKRLFILAYNNTAGNNQVSIDSFKKYFLPRVKIENYNIEIDERNFSHQPINDSIKQYDEVRKISTGQGDDYTTGCFLDFAYFEKNCRLITADLSKQKALDADSWSIQQIIFTGKRKATASNTVVIIYYILE